MLGPRQQPAQHGRLPGRHRTQQPLPLLRVEFTKDVGGDVGVERVEHGSRGRKRQRHEQIAGGVRLEGRDELLPRLGIEHVAQGRELPRIQIGDLRLALDGLGHHFEP